MKRKKILVVDDDTALTDVLKQQFAQHAEYEVRVENNAVNAAIVARQFRPDLVLLDIMMPGQDGGDVAASIRSQMAVQRVTIVYMTGAVRKKEVDEGQGFIGEEPFIAKPFDFQYLIRRIRQHLAKSPDPAG
jgi:DNA-binding response OmpR family regulator